MSLKQTVRFVVIFEECFPAPGRHCRAGKLRGRPAGPGLRDAFAMSYRTPVSALTPDG